MANLKKYYPKDMTFCMYGDECKMLCKRKLRDYEFRLLNCEACFADLRYTEYCELERDKDNDNEE